MKEIIIATNAGAYCLPDFQGKDYSDSLSSLQFDRLGLWHARTTKAPNRNLETLVSAEIRQIGNDQITCRWHGKHRGSNKGLIIIDPEYAAIDLMGAIFVNLDLESEEVILLDAELVGTRLLDRDIFLFHPADFAALVYSDEPVVAVCHFKGGESRGPVLMGGSPYMNPPLLGAAAAVLSSIGPEVLQQYQGRAPLPPEARTKVTWSSLR